MMKINKPAGNDNRSLLIVAPLLVIVTTLLFALAKDGAAHNQRRRMVGRWECITAEKPIYAPTNPADIPVLPSSISCSRADQELTLGDIVNVTTKDYGVRQGKVVEHHGPQHVEVKFTIFNDEEKNFELADGKSYMCRADQMVHSGITKTLISRDGRVLNLGDKVMVATWNGLTEGVVCELSGNGYVHVNCADQMSYEWHGDFIIHADGATKKQRRRMTEDKRWECITAEVGTPVLPKDSSSICARDGRELNLGDIVNVTTKDYGVRQGEVVEYHGSQHVEVKFTIFNDEEKNFKLNDGKSYMCRADQMVHSGITKTLISRDGRVLNLGDKVMVVTWNGQQEGEVCEHEGNGYVQVLCADQMSYKWHGDFITHADE